MANKKDLSKAPVDLTSNTENDTTRSNVEGGILDPVHGATNPTLRGESYPQAVRDEVGDFEGRTIGQPRPWEKYQNDMAAAIDKANDEYRKVQSGGDTGSLVGGAQDSQDPANAGNDGKGSNSETPLLGEETLENATGGNVVAEHVKEARKEDKKS